jgi:hypothetical protein
MPRRYRNAGDNVQTHGWSEVFQKDRIALNDLRRPQIVGINVDWKTRPNPSALGPQQSIVRLIQLPLENKGRPECGYS